MSQVNAVQAVGQIQLTIVANYYAPVFITPLTKQSLSLGNNLTYDLPQIIDADGDPFTMIVTLGQA